MLFRSSRAWFPAFANYRRDGYDMDALWSDGMARYADKSLYDLTAAHAPVLSRNLRDLGGYGREGRKGFDQSITRLQHQCYVLISDFVYMRDRFGEPYGWGVAEYSTPERFMGSRFTDHVYQRTPEESYERIAEHFRKLFPYEEEQTLTRRSEERRVGKECRSRWSPYQ